MQNKQCVIQFFSPPDDRFAASPRAAIVEPVSFWELTNFADFSLNSPISQNSPNSRKKRLNSWESLNSRKKRIAAPQPTPIHKLSRTPMVWNISVGQLGWLSGCAPSQLLHTCSLAEHGKLKEVLNFLATAKNISVINILLVLNPKRSSYWEEN